MQSFITNYMYNHQKSQIESRRGEEGGGGTVTYLLYCACYIDVTVRQHMNCFQHFQSYNKGKNLA